jgi:hypothetical protein
MKTPREILLQRHRVAQPKLDAIRKSVVTSLPDHRIANSPAVAGRCHPLHEFILSLRWHLAGMGAAWLLILLLKLNIGHSTTLASAMPATKIPPPQIILASLRENRRELLQLIQPSEPREVRPPKLFPRSERHDEILIA